MSNYVISTAVNGSITIQAGLIDTSQTSLSLIGRGAAGYGQAVAQNTVYQLTNFAGPTAPANPLIGQLWYDSTNSSLNYYTGSSNWDQIAQESQLANYAPLSAFTTAQSQIASLIANSATQAELANYVTVSQLYNPPAGSPALPISAGGTGLGSIGTPGEILVVNTAGNALQWATPASLFTSGGSVMLTNSSNVPTADNTFALGSGTARYSNIYSVTFDGVATSAQYADLAERYETDMPLEAGDVVMLGGDNEITKVVGEFNTDVFGVISTAPAFKMNSEAGDDSVFPYVALTGRVPVKVVGQVKKGQRLVSSSIDGVAMAADIANIPNAFVVIGRALADKTTDDIGLVEATVGAK
jgi:hypothetical protein